jgi:signal transduction histidine kinase/ActR/RegA family two-component response regulator
MQRWIPTSLAGRFALASAGLAAVALLLISVASWWLLNQQHERAAQALAAHERQARAAALGADLRALTGRMAEIAASPLLATGLVDSAGRETYLVPFLQGIRQINGIPVQVLFTDFQGREIASNGAARFSPEQTTWLQRMIEQGRPAAVIFGSPQGDELVAMEPMVYARTPSPEGAVLYKVALRDIDRGASVRLQWGAPQAGTGAAAEQPVPVPAVLEPLRFRVRDSAAAPAEGVREPLPFIHIMLAAAGLFVLVVVAGWRLARLLTADVHGLQAFARTMLVSGLGTERAPDGGSAEASGLAQAINAMLDRLNEQHATLLAEREKLTRLTDALQSADRKKDEYLAMLGHELRNPMAPISAGAQLLRLVPGSDPRVVRTSEMIARQVKQMTRIVDDLLDVSRVTRGLVTLERAPLDLREVINAAVEQARPLVDARRQALTLRLPAEPIGVHGDQARLIQVLGNLLSNAVRYTPERGAIIVAAWAEEDRAVAAVQDNGVGIPPALMPELFDLFTQGSRSVDRSQGGLGLGLALVKHLVELHGGVVEAASEGPGRGATFTVRLPLARLPASGPQAAGHDLPPAEPATAAAEPPAPAHGRGALRILIVDDNVDAAQSLGDWLRLQGHHVHAVHDGAAALACAGPGADPIDACIVDIGLPRMDGWELARRLRDAPATAHAMLIALSGYGQASDRERSAQAGFAQHLVKPPDVARLAAILAAASDASMPPDGRSF